jgi:lipoate-protein ligase A
LETRFRKSIKQYLNKVYRELREAESEIQEVEEAVMKNLKKNLENTEETDLSTPNIFQENKKKHRWKWWSRK